jgi:RNA polymerase sigma-70 factor (ECF subfamily)
VLDEPELVERAKTDPEAFALLYERHVRSVFAFALSKVGDVSNAEDITSQTFLKALRGLPRYTYRGAPFRSWLLRIAANVVVDTRRAASGVVPLQHRPDGREPEEEIQVADERAEQDISAWEQAEAFNRLIADLTAEQRTVVQLRFVDGLQITGIAAKMSRSEGSVKMLLMRALQNLRRSLSLEACDAG